MPRILLIKIRFVSISLTCLFLLTGCGIPLFNEAPLAVSTLYDLAYTTNQRNDPIVYIEESHGYEPYLVLTSDYGGNVLLLRKYLLPETIPFTRSKDNDRFAPPGGGYYEGSTIDNYLNLSFFATLNTEVKTAIETSEIVITSRDSLGTMDLNTITISRKIFLLSLKELGLTSASAAVEGVMLQYFDRTFITRQITTLPNGEKCQYWTRTASTWGNDSAYIIGDNGTYTYVSANNSLGVRPAFCLNNDTAVTPRTDIIDGQTVYVVLHK